MFLTKKTLVTISFFGFLNFSSIFATEEAHNAAEQIVDTIRTNEIANITTRLIAKSAVELNFKDKKTFEDDAQKALLGIILEETAPLKNNATLISQHADLVLPTCVKMMYNENAKMFINTDTKTLKNTAIAVLKKETGKGFFINKDFKNLKSASDFTFFLLDCSTEILDDKAGTIKKKGNDINYKSIACDILKEKILSPLTMAYAGDKVVSDVSKNKNVKKALSGLIEKYIVGKIIDTILNKAFGA